MASASTLARSAKWTPWLAAIVTTIVMASCTSPTDLDIERTKTYMDGAVHPTRLSFYYYFGDSAYEAIVSDTSLLNSVWIERGTTPWTVTVPLLKFELPDSIHATQQNTPFPRTISFSTTGQLADGVFRTCTNVNSWISGEYLDLYGNRVDFNWMADNTGRQIRMAYQALPDERLVKGSMQIVLADPVKPAFATYRALVTLEY
jgi:hypothetical protein